MEYFLIDFQNVIPSVFPDLTADQAIIVFTGDKQTKINLGLVQWAQPLGKQVEWKPIAGSGPNALDFHIAFYIGRISAKEPESSFVILSQDKGFDPLVQHVRSLGSRCERVESFPVKKIKNVSVIEMAASLIAHFQKIEEIQRPHKAAKLKAYIKNKTRREDEVAESIIAELSAGGYLEIKDGKVVYLQTGA